MTCFGNADKLWTCLKLILWTLFFYYLDHPWFIDYIKDSKLSLFILHFFVDFDLIRDQWAQSELVYITFVRRQEMIITNRCRNGF